LARDFTIFSSLRCMVMRVSCEATTLMIMAGLFVGARAQANWSIYRYSDPGFPSRHRSCRCEPTGLDHRASSYANQRLADGSYRTWSGAAPKPPASRISRADAAHFMLSILSKTETYHRASTAFIDGHLKHATWRSRGRHQCSPELYTRHLGAEKHEIIRLAE
jgi:hypothetical protein